MNKFFYPKLAVNNIKKNSKTYIPYMLTCIGTIMMFYNICFLVVAKDIEIVQDSGSLRQVMLLGAMVIGIFSLIFLFYTNSFLIKKRKKEFGLFNILGMEKKHISKIIFFETLITSSITLIVGILSGILLSKLIILFLFKILSFNATFGFEISPTAIFASLCLFGSINVINFIFNITQVHLSKPVELLKGGNVGEREPKTKWLLTIVGALCLGTGYYIAVVTESPLAALNLFFVAVMLVIVGTYCLFTAGSIAVLKRLRKNKKYYYKPNHFVSVSGMIYRMKQNAAGLSNICILSTMVIVMISSTISLYTGMEDILKIQYPKDIIISAYEISDEEAKTLNEIINQQTSAAYIEQKDVIYYRSTELLAIQEGTYFKPVENQFDTMDSISTIGIITLEEFNRMENKAVELKDDECLLYSQRGNITENELNLNGYNITIKEKLTSLSSLDREAMASITNSYVIVVKSLDTVNRISASMNITERVDIRSYYYGFNIDEDSEVHVNLINNINSSIRESDTYGRADGPELSRESFYTMYGGLFFLGIFLGILFIMATVLIIYYKQIAEGYDDKERFDIMQKVGMSRSEIKKAIKSQVLTVFFLPLITTVVHIVFAFKVITKLLLIFGMTNVPLFAMCTVATIAVFALFYLMVYYLTARVYYQIVS